MQAFKEYKSRHIDIFAKGKNKVEKKIEDDDDTDIDLNNPDVISLGDYVEDDDHGDFEEERD